MELPTSRPDVSTRSGEILKIVLLYAAFAALWILLSDKAMGWLFQETAQSTLFSTLKGWAFVAVTSALLYRLMKRLPGSATGAGPPMVGLRSVAWPLGLMTVVIVVITGAGIGYTLFQHQEREVARLQAIADLKTRQIEAWIEERLGDARFMQSNRLWGRLYRQWRDEGETASRDLLLSRLRDFVENKGFQRALLLDESNEILWSTQADVSTLEPGVRDAVRGAPQEHSAIHLGPYRDTSGVVRLDLIVPLLSTGKRPGPTVILGIDPEKSLFAMLQTWPVPSVSGETLLFRREGDQVVYLNELRHQPDTALKLRIGVSEERVLAAQVARKDARENSPVEGVDYRGVKSIGIVRSIPGTDWSLVAKVDQAELHGPMIRDVLWITLFGVLALLLSGGAIFLLRQRQDLAISERERAVQAEKLRALQLLDAIAEGSNDAIFAKDEAGRYLLFNREAARLTGKTAEEVLGRDDTTIFPSDQATLIQAHDRQVMDENRTVSFQEDLSTADGDLTFLAIKGPLRDAAGNVKGMFGISRDITELKHAEESLREKEAFIRTVLDNLPVGIAVNSFDPEVKFEYMNDRFPAFYRTTREALADPDAFWDAVYEDPRFRKEIRARMLADCESGNPDRMLWEDVPITREGSKTAFITARNIPLPEQHLMISTVWDVTERKSLEAQLLQAQRMEAVGRLAGGVAHDYNNILGIILGYAELALGRVAPGDPLREDLREIITAAKRSAEITRQLLAFARRQTIAPVVLDLSQTVEGMLKMLRRLIGEDIDLAWLPRVDDWRVRMDPAQIDQILANLCINARDAISGVGKITIETDKVTFDEAYCADHLGFIPGEFVMLAVSDNGCGMDRETREHLFEPFFTTKGMGKGTGLGLATVYGIVKQNSGFINVYSEPGKGSTFRVYLPRDKEGAVAAETLARREPSRGHGETLLLVEDEQAFLNMGKTMLEGLGYRVLAASNPAVAMQMASEHAGEVRLVITDVVMPDMNGRDLAERLHTLHPNLKCLYMSGYTANAIAHRGVLDEGVRFIQKPFSLEELAAKVREALECDEPRARSEASDSSSERSQEGC